jgi:hypothetical protein
VTLTAEGLILYELQFGGLHEKHAVQFPNWNVLEDGRKPMNSSFIPCHINVILRFHHRDQPVNKYYLEKLLTFLVRN